MTVQPSLFAESRKRKPPPAIERRTHIAVADLMRRLLRPGWLFLHIPNGEMRTRKTGALLKRMGVMPGTLDFLLIDPKGQHYWLELKRDRLGRPSPAQLAFMQQLEMRHVPYAVTYSFDGAVDQLRAWDALKPFTRQ